MSDTDLLRAQIYATCLQAAATWCLHWGYDEVEVGIQALGWYKQAIEVGRDPSVQPPGPGALDAGA